MSKKHKEKPKGFSGSFGGAKAAANVSRTETPVSEGSNSTAYVLGAISEGEVEGPYNWTQNVYLDEVPILNSDGSTNFKEYEFHFRNGTQAQETINFNTGNDSFVPTTIENSLIPETAPDNTEFIFIYDKPIYLNYVTFEILMFAIISYENLNAILPAINYQVFARNDNTSDWVLITERLFTEFGDLGIFAFIHFRSELSSIEQYGLYPNKLGKATFSLDFLASFGSPSNYFEIKLKKIPMPTNSQPNLTQQFTNIMLYRFYGVPGGSNNQISNEIPVQTEVKHNLEIIREFTSLAINAVKVKLAFVLQEQDDKGNVYGAGVDFIIWVKEPNSEFSIRVYTNFTGRYPSPTEVDFLIPLYSTPSQSNANYSIKVQKIQIEQNDPKIQRQIIWVSYTQINFTSLQFPNTAIAGFKFNTEYFQRIPSVAIKLAGRKIQIPSNATIQANLPGKPEVRYLTFQGHWNGTFQTPNQACSDPAWILYDLLKHTRYGLGNYIDTTQIDKWGLYEISKYCNELVPDGMGGLEPRFSCNVKLEGKVEAYQVIQNLVSIFRGFAYWQAGVVSFVADKSNPVVHQFTQADIEEGSFTYSRSGLKARKTIAVVSYLNPIDFFKKAVEVVEDPVGRQRWGIRELEIEAIACTSRGQARRAGVAALLTNRLEQESVTFKARAFAAFVKPGDLIRIYDSKRAAARYAGIIKAATALTVTLDSPVNLPSGTTYKITVTTSTLQIPELEGGNNLADPAQKQKVRFKIVEATITNNGNNLTVLELQSPGFGSDIPPAESNWVIQGGDLSNTIYRVINRSPVQDSIEGMHEILAVEYNSSKYAFIDNMTFL